MQIRRLTMVKLLGSHALGNHGGVWLLGRGLTPTNRVREPPSSVGDPLPGPTPSQLEQFGDGQVHFEEEETAEDGPGPVFSNTACVACHSSPAIGGGQQHPRNAIWTDLEKQVRPDDGIRWIADPVQGIPPEGACSGETVPPAADYVADRKTTPLFGLGLMDHVPDDVFTHIAKGQQQIAPGVAGTPHMVKAVATGKMKVDRFGWKAQIAAAKTFSEDAYLSPPLRLDCHSEQCKGDRAPRHAAGAPRAGLIDARRIRRAYGTESAQDDGSVDGGNRRVLPHTRVGRCREFDQSPSGSDPSASSRF
jgi:hypothetical protein